MFWRRRNLPPPPDMIRPVASDASAVTRELRNIKEMGASVQAKAELVLSILTAKEEGQCPPTT